jgi:hypothetical protein
MSINGRMTLLNDPNQGLFSLIPNVMGQISIRRTQLSNTSPKSIKQVNEYETFSMGKPSFTIY